MVKVAVAMSGGVDSSVAAALLKKQGFEVIGLTMRFDAVRMTRDAEKVCRQLGIKHYSFDFTQQLKKQVIDNFCKEYLIGRTPNPCVRCNKSIKFGVLLKKALSLGARFLATGHYARIVRDTSGFSLKKARDRTKDQSYFLYRLNQQQLKHVLFPLGEYVKSDVRQLARGFKLPVADTSDSQEICFLTGRDYRELILKSKDRKSITPGPILDTKGIQIGTHRGIAFYTVGQREGLGIALGYPVYITGIYPKNNTITVGRKEDVLKKEFLVQEAHCVLKPIKKKIALAVRIRYNHKEAIASIMPYKNKFKVVFRKPQFAITPGQSAVFYDGDVVVGGGIIDRVLR